MSQQSELTVTQLASAEIDDQAVEEISILLGAGDRIAGEDCQALLMRMAAFGPLVVARRPCGQSPEIVGVAGVAPDPGGARRLVAIAPALLSKTLERRMAEALAAIPKGPSLFRPRERAPLGFLSHVA